MNLHSLAAALRRVLPPEHADDVDALLGSPAAAAVAESVDAARVAERRDLLADLAALPAMNQQRQREAAQRLAAVEAELEAARAKVRQVEEARAAAYAEQVFASVAQEHAMARLEQELISSADPRIGAMIHALRQAQQWVRNADQYRFVPDTWSSRKGKLESNWAEIHKVMGVVNEAIGRCSEMQRLALTAREIETNLHQVADRVQVAVRRLGGKGPVLAATGEITLGNGPADPRTEQRTARRAKPVAEGLARAKAILDAAR